MRILVAGGGVAAIETVLALRAPAGERVEIELLAPGGDLIARAPSVRAPFDGADTPRVALAEPGVTRHRGALAAVEGNVAVTTDGAHHRFDRLVVAGGARPVEAVPGATVFRGPVSAGAVENALRGERVVLTAPDDAWTLPDRVIDGALVTRDGEVIPADAVVALPACRGRTSRAFRTRTGSSRSTPMRA